MNTVVVPHNGTHHTTPTPHTANPAEVLDEHRELDMRHRAKTGSKETVEAVSEGLVIFLFR